MKKIIPILYCHNIIDYRPLRKYKTGTNKNTNQIETKKKRQLNAIKLLRHIEVRSWGRLYDERPTVEKAKHTLYCEANRKGSNTEVTKSVLLYYCLCNI